MKKVVIIGAGIAGLTCGIYARLNGFDTEIYEMHTLPGGECTGWDRGGYHFDGCIHWLVGSRDGTNLNGLWRDTGALTDSVEIMNHEVYTRYEEDGRAVNLYADPDRLEKHLIEISPRDKRQIKKFAKALRMLADMDMPIGKPMDMMTAGEGIRYMAGNMRKIGMMSKYNNMPMADFAATFAEPLIKRAILSAIPGDYTAIALIMAMAGMGVGDNGYPMGGSRAFAKRMEKRYLDLGGQIQYRACVDRILVENGKAAGIRLTNGTEITGEYIVSCADGYATLTRMLDDRFTPDMYRKLFADPAKYPTSTCSIVFMGVDADLPDYRSVTVRRREPVDLSGNRTEYAQLLNYHFEPAAAPAGKTVLACYYEADYDYWHGLHRDKEQYAAEKKRLAEDAVSLCIERYPEAEGKIEVTDVVTPMTYEKYCNAWRGAWMSWGKPDKDIPRYYPGVPDGLSNFIMAGMWTQPPGGLPGAAMAGRFAAHRLCAWEGREFKTG